MKPQPILFKLIGYAYPSSDTATKAGFGGSGCYFVELLEANWTSHENLHFSVNKEEVIAKADERPEAYHAGYLRFHDINNGHKEIRREDRQ